MPPIVSQANHIVKCIHPRKQILLLKFPPWDSCDVKVWEVQFLANLLVSKWEGIYMIC